MLIDRLLAPFRRFSNTATAGGIVLLTATVVALFWANSPWATTYQHLWETPVTVGIGRWTFPTTVHHLINDGLMTVFFFVVGLEIKREMLAGELASPRRAALPMLAALGGMLVPAMLYALVNTEGAGKPGWGIPMATDIAFALGVLALLGDRVPTALKVFLAAFAIVDDLGAVLVIALFYSSGIVWGALAMAAAILLLTACANLAGVRSPWIYGIFGLMLWGAVLTSGIHATIAGVLLAMTIPVRTRLHESHFLERARHALDDFDAAATVTATDPSTTILSNVGHHTALRELERLSDEAQPPLIRLEHALHGIVTFGIMPLFALANAGVAFDAAALHMAATSPVTLGVAIGLLIGKPIGITLFSWLAVRSRIATLPVGVTWHMLAGTGVLGGIGFTMALFIGELALPVGALRDTAKIGVFVASVCAGIGGWLLLRRTMREPSPNV